MPKQVVYTIEEDGTVTIDAQGFTNEECQAATKATEEALGTVQSRRKKTVLSPVASKNVAKVRAR